MKNLTDSGKLRPSDADLLQFLEKNPIATGKAGSGFAAPDEESGRNELGELHSEPFGSTECPESNLVLLVASASVDEDESLRLLSHAAECEACAGLLMQALHVMSAPASAEETAAVAEMAAARGEWQRNLARELASTARQQKPGLFHPRFYRNWGMVAATVAVALAIGTVLVWQQKRNTPDRQLAIAYTQSRTFELRIPEADYAGISANNHTRGASASFEPAPLLEARALLARELQRAPLDRHWQQLLARADLLEERYDPAIEILDRLLAEGPVTVDLLADAASAYFQRGLVSGSEFDRSTALDYLRRADSINPTEPLVLFNEAIVMEDRGQMINAVEVWNRYLTVERDPQWAAEGRRKLAALEQTLNRLKLHEGRIEQMLSSPDAMERLANKSADLAALDEELTSAQLDKLLLKAFPIMTSGIQESAARGSPCDASCDSARNLLKALAHSLEIKHHDSWLADLLSLDLNSIPSRSIQTYTQALQRLAQAIREDQTGVPEIGLAMATRSQSLFRKLNHQAIINPSLTAAARAGEARATVETMFARQRNEDFNDCRLLAQQFRASPVGRWTEGNYPWINIVAMLTNKVCDDTPATRSARLRLGLEALRLAQKQSYRLLVFRTQLRLADDAMLVGNEEDAERLAITTVHQLFAAEAPLVRIVNTQIELQYMEGETTRAYSTEACLRELLAWLELAHDHSTMAQIRMALARTELRIGSMADAAVQLRMAQQQGQAAALGETEGADFVEQEILLASTMLERSDLTGASFYLHRASLTMKNYSSLWGLRHFASVRGQLDLMRGNLDQAAATLEAQIRQSEGQAVRMGDLRAAAEDSLQDHDLYAELAATWLAQHRPAESILALWERFRLRSHGLPIHTCRQLTLDCEQSQILAKEHEVGGNLLIGQIVLLDRVLTYRMDNEGVVWNQKPVRRRDILEAARTMERAVSSPFTSAQTAEKFGSSLTDALLPQLTSRFGPQDALLLEPDPLLQNLPWPVLPTSKGPLGIEYPLTEARSILRSSPQVTAWFPSSGADTSLPAGNHALIIGASVPGRGEAPLPEALLEAQHVNQLLHSPGPFLGSNATTAHIGSALNSATIFHFAGHALQGMQGTELLLAPTSTREEAPWVDEAFLRLHPPRQCRLAVLSACATGNRNAMGNHPLQNMVDTLSSLGVPQVVATRWQIDSEAAVPLIDAFYKNLARGTTVAMALSSARRLQFSQARFNNPYYWGAYYATGSQLAQLEKETHGRR